jgi:hypothetical protein
MIAARGIHALYGEHDLLYGRSLLLEWRKLSEFSGH